jgi:hypothetical protein
MWTLRPKNAPLGNWSGFGANSQDVPFCSAGVLGRSNLLERRFGDREGRKSDTQSLRRADAGSTLAAREAGINTPSIAIAQMAKTALESVSGSFG